MDFVEAYLAKNQFRPVITEAPNPDLNTCVVMPCYNEPYLLRSMESLYNCDRPVHAVEVIIVINSPENCDKTILERNLATSREVLLWIEKRNDPKLRFHMIHRPNLPEKFAGVGLARKIGMDEAAYRLYKVNNTCGIITGFDADSLCDKNYLVEIERHFKVLSKTPGASVYFEHPISGHDFEPDVYEGIIQYELHLRYLQQALRYVGHPHAFHTIGSSFAVRMDAYVKQGGMNKRKAGEDFYFLQKIISLGNYTEISTTRVIPSPRISDRVPFGTGASMQRWHLEQIFKTYPLEAFADIKQLICGIDNYYEVEKDAITQIFNTFSFPLQEFLKANNFITEWKSVVSNSASLQAFRNRFFRWFNVFKVIQYLNYASQNFYTKPDIAVEAKKLLCKIGLEVASGNPKELLEMYRHLDQQGFEIIPIEHSI